jgi:hypothetical protein
MGIRLASEAGVFRPTAFSNHSYPTPSFPADFFTLIRSTHFLGKFLDGKGGRIWAIPRAAKTSAGPSSAVSQVLGDGKLQKGEIAGKRFIPGESL